jgi:hypothetical protein
MAYYTSAKERSVATAARKIARARAKELGATIAVDESGGWFELILTAPDGHKFYGCDLHEQVIANAGPVSDGLWRRAMEALIDERVIACDIESCEWCGDNQG